MTSPGQERLWFLAQLEPSVPIFNLGRFLRLGTEIDPAQVEEAIAHIVDRHEALRTYFTVCDGMIAGMVTRSLRVHLDFTDLTTVREHERESAFIRIARKDTAKIFALTNPPLWRARLVRVSGDDWRLIHVAHRMIFDQVSAINFDEELATYLTPEFVDQPLLPDLPMTPAEYTARMNTPIQIAQRAQLLRYWRTTLADLPQDTGLPTDRPRPAKPTYRGDHITLTLPDTLTANIASLAQRTRTTVFDVLLAG
ncbi:MAG: hypothetical protein JXA67_11645, partial [Micromonosporaceae bacterium]|nr:hypothetical protein [Micromonosporaceae bacterium]